MNDLEKILSKESASGFKNFCCLPYSKSGWDIAPYGTGIVCTCPEHEPRYIDTHGNIRIIEYDD